MDAVMDLARRLAPKPGRWYFEQGEADPKAGWTAGNVNLPITEVLAGVADNRSLVMFKRVQLETDYKQILDAIQEELSDIFGFDMTKRYRDGLMTVLVASPGRVTPYHIDGEANLLMQMQGSKSVYIFDGDNREVLSTRELEGFWSGDIKAATLKEHLQNQAWEYIISPGDGVTNPVIFPHWVRNGADVSISLSMNFKRVVDNVADSYKVNSQLRKLGWRPMEPGRVRAIDQTKGMIYRTAKRLKKQLAAKPAAPSVPGKQVQA
jgi:hypothetical protein